MNSNLAMDTQSEIMACLDMEMLLNKSMNKVRTKKVLKEMYPYVIYIFNCVISRKAPPTDPNIINKIASAVAQ